MWTTLGCKCDAVMLLLLVIFVIFSTSQAYDVEEAMTPAEMIAHWGYQVENHDVVTEDGYILSMQRIPQPRGSRGTENATACRHIPILLLHGMIQDASAYVLNPPESSPGMILADAGFDVFLINVRGTFVSQRHKTLKPSDKAFWRFTMDDMAKYDVPAAIDKALSLNGASALYLVSHSRGTIVSNMMLSERTEYNKKVKAVFELAGPGSFSTIRGVTGLGLKLLPFVMPLLDLYKTNFGPHEIGLNAPMLIGGATRLFCLGPLKTFCELTLTLGMGAPARSYNTSRMPVYFSHMFVSVSSWDVLQLAQHAVRDAVYHFDVSPTVNVQRYAQATAPAYDYKNIDTELYFFWSRKDLLLPRIGIEQWFREHTKPGVVKGAFEVPEYNHMDFVMATDVGEKIFNKIISIVRSKEENACTK